MYVQAQLWKKKPTTRVSLEIKKDAIVKLIQTTNDGLSYSVWSFRFIGSSTKGLLLEILPNWTGWNEEKVNETFKFLRKRIGYRSLKMQLFLSNFVDSNNSFIYIMLFLSSRKYSLSFLMCFYVAFDPKVNLTNVKVFWNCLCRSANSSVHVSTSPEKRQCLIRKK